MNKSVIRTLSLALAASLIFGQASPAFAADSLAPASINSTMVPDRAAAVRGDISQKLEPGAIGNGTPLSDLAQGKLPPRIGSPGGETIEKIRSAIDLAIRTYLDNRAQIPSRHAIRAEQALANLIALQDHLTRRLHLFNAVVDGPEDYLLGFNRQGTVGLSVELVNLLHSVSPMRLAQYIFHECVPENGLVTERDDHRVIYSEIQLAIFGESEVSGLGADLRAFITDPKSQDARLPFAASYARNITTNEDLIDRTIEELIAGSNGDDVVVFMDKDETITSCNVPIEPDKLEVIARLLMRGIHVIIVTGGSPEKSYPNIIEPTEKRLAELGQKNKLRNIRFYYLAGAEGVYYDNDGERKYYRLENEFSQKDRMLILRSYALSFMEQLAADLGLGLASDIGRIENAVSPEEVKAVFDEVMTRHKELLGDVMLTDNPKGFTLELLASAMKKAKPIIANIGFMTKVRARYDAYISGRIEMKGAAIKHGPTFITTNMVDKERVMERVPEILGIPNPRVIAVGDTATDYGFLGYSKPGMRKASFLVGEPGAEGEAVPPNVIISDAKGPNATKRMLEKLLSSLPAPRARAESAVGTGAAEDRDMLYRATLFKAGLLRVLAAHPDRKLILAIDTDIGESQKHQIMPIYTAIDQLKSLKDREGNPLLPNLVVLRGSGESGLTRQIDEAMGEGASRIKEEDVFVVARNSNVEKGLFDALKGKSWISAIDDKKSGNLNYLPVFETATLTIMAALNADTESIRRFYDSISSPDNPIRPEAFEEMLKTRVIYILPKASPIDTETLLRGLYEKAREIYLSA